MDAKDDGFDVTVEEIEQDGNIKQIYIDRAGDWGGDKVDQAFNEFMLDIFGMETMHKFRAEDKVEYLSLCREFKTTKNKIRPDSTAKISFRIPVHLINKFQKVRRISFKDFIKSNMAMLFVGDKLRVDPDMLKAFYEEPCKKITQHLDGIFHEAPVVNTNVILMVGEFSESPMLQEAIKRAFPCKTVIIPDDAGLAVLKGAVQFGCNPKIIDPIMCRVTKGVSINKHFRRRNYHVYRRKIFKDHMSYTDRFRNYVQREQSIKNLDNVYPKLDLKDEKLSCEEKTKSQLQIDDTNNKLREDNDSIRRENNTSKVKVLQLLKEKEDMSRELNHKVIAAKADHEKLNKEKDELIRLLKDESNQSKEKCNKLEREIENLNKRGGKDGNAMTTSLPDPDRPANLGRQFSELFEEEWSEAISELGGDNRKNTNYLRNIVTESYAFAKSCAQKFLESLDNAILQINRSVQVKNPNISKINKAHRRNIANYLAKDLHESFVSESQTHMECGPLVTNFIKKLVPLCFKMVLHEPPLALSTQKEGSIDPICFDPYQEFSGEMNYVIWPALYLHDGGIVLCKGIACGIK